MPKNKEKKEKKLKTEHTNRGFAFNKFTDLYGFECSLQKSSSMRPAIWLGIDDTKPQIMASDTPEGGTGWVPYHIPKEVSISSRMHLSQEQVKDLLPILKHFAKTGELPE